MTGTGTARQTTDAPDARPRSSIIKRGWVRLWPVTVLAAAFIMAWALGLFQYLSLETLGRYRESLDQGIARRPAMMGLLYLAIYTMAVALSVPAGPVLTMTGGLLFGPWIGIALVVPAATIGASIQFLAVRSALASAVAKRAGRLMDRLRPGLERDGFWYLLSIRLLPIVPYTVGSIAPALVGMRLPAFIAATALGILPGTAMFAFIGAGLDTILDQGRRPDSGVLLSWPVLLPLAGLAVLSLLALWWRRRGA